MQKKYFTSPIYYINDIPHIGHAYNILAIDTLARFWRQKIGKENVFFLTGTDENSQKTVDAAAKNNQEIYEYLEEISGNWRKTWDQLGIKYDDFIRTTEERHVKTVHEFMAKMEHSGDIYKGKYMGKYCTGCETFLKETDLNEAGECPDHLKKPEVLEEENYFFRLSKYEDFLLDFYEKNPDWLLPEKRKNEVLSFIKSGLEDISISRETAEFGIDFPSDPKHKIYVWTEALINYYSALRSQNKLEFWPFVEHIIGKEITKFHCIIWPAMLKSVGIDLPQGVFAHGFFTIDNTKMSKSLGNVVDPLDLSRKFGNDALRVGLLSSFEFGNDGDFSAKNFEQFYNAKLCGGVGNLFNRVVVLLHKFTEGKKPAKTEKTQNFEAKKSEFETLMEKKKIKGAIDFYFQTVDEANQLLSETQVWKLAKTDLPQAKPIFADLLEYLEFLLSMAEVLLPEKFESMQKMLGDKNRVGAPEILYPRV